MRVINTRALPADDGIDTTAHLGTEESGEDHKFAGAESFGGEEETALFGREYIFISRRCWRRVQGSLRRLDRCDSLCFRAAKWKVGPSVTEDTGPPGSSRLRREM
jgi:hypothetical protein